MCVDFFSGTLWSHFYMHDAKISDYIATLGDDTFLFLPYSSFAGSAVIWPGQFCVSISRLKASMQYKNQVNFIEVVYVIMYWHLAVQQYFVKLHEA